MEQFMDANEIFQALMTQKNKPMADVDGIIQVIEQVAKVMQTGKGKVDADLVAKVRKGKRPDTIKLINQIVDGNERQFLDEVWGIACMLSPNKYDILPVRSYWEKIKNHKLQYSVLDALETKYTDPDFIKKYVAKNKNKGYADIARAIVEIEIGKLKNPEIKQKDIISVLSDMDEFLQMEHYSTGRKTWNKEIFSILQDLIDAEKGKAKPDKAQILVYCEYAIKFAQHVSPKKHAAEIEQMFKPDVVLADVVEEKPKAKGGKKKTGEKKPGEKSGKEKTGEKKPAGKKKQAGAGKKKKGEKPGEEKPEENPGDVEVIVVDEPGGVDDQEIVEVVDVEQEEPGKDETPEDAYDRLLRRAEAWQRKVEAGLNTVGEKIDEFVQKPEVQKLQADTQKAFEKAMRAVVNSVDAGIEKVKKEATRENFDKAMQSIKRKVADMQKWFEEQKKKRD